MSISSAVTLKHFTQESQTISYGERMNIKKGIGSKFTSKYKINSLVYFEEGDNVNQAIYREKQIKGWLRLKKIALIEESNPEWEDLSKNWF